MTVYYVAGANMAGVYSSDEIGPICVTTAHDNGATALKIANALNAMQKLADSAEGNSVLDSSTTCRWVT